MNQALPPRAALTKSRIRTMVFILIFVFAIFALRLIDVQSIRAAGFAAKANNELTKVNTLLAAPVFKTVMSFVLQSEKVAPTAPSQISYQLTEAALLSKNTSISKPSKPSAPAKKA